MKESFRLNDPGKQKVFRQHHQRSMANFAGDSDVSRIRAVSLVSGSSSSYRRRCRMVKRCLCCILAIGVLPVVLIYTLIGNELYRIKHPPHHATIFDNHSHLHVEESIAASRTLSRTETDLIEARMHERINLLNEKCSDYALDVHGNDSLHKPNSWEFLVNKKHHIIWCNVFKAASTSWMYNFNLLAGYSPQFLRKSNIVALELARKRYGRVSVKELANAMNESITFLIVRHPFERLLSAYRDKIMFALPHSLHDKLGIKIVRKYRKYKTGKFPKWPLFSEFVEYLLDEINSVQPKIDMHWVPIVQFCTPCQIKFDIIAKFETLSEDQRYIIEKAKLQKFIKPQWKNSGRGRNTHDLITKFYSQLTKSQLDGLSETYKYDLELFGYSAKPYYGLVKSDGATNT